MEISHGLPTFYNQKLLEIALPNDQLFSLCIVRIKLGSSGSDWYGPIVGEKVVGMIGIPVLMKLENSWWVILSFDHFGFDCPQY